MRQGIALTLIAAALSLSACGGDDDSSGGDGGEGSSEAATLTMEISGPDQATKITAPETAEAGLTTIELTNSAKGEHGIQLASFDEGHTAEEALAAGGAWADGGKPLPDWVHLNGGGGTL